MKTQQLADDLKRQVADLQKQLTTKTTETVRLNENLHNTQVCDVLNLLCNYHHL